MGIYLYGVMAETDWLPAVQGMDGATLAQVSLDGVTAVFSLTDQTKYEQTRRHMMTHTRVLEALLTQQTVLPVRFNTIADDETAVVEQLLRARRAELLGLLDEMRGRLELGIKAYWYEATLFENLLAENPPIKLLRDGLLNKTPEESYYERIKLGEMIEVAMDEKRERDREKILSVLRPLAVQTKTSHIGTERMVVNGSFLVDQANEAAFDAAVEQLDAELGAQMKFKYIGSAPPYNFVTLVVDFTKTAVAAAS